MQQLIKEALATKREILLRKREVLRMTGLSNSTFYNRIKEGVLKPGVPIGPRMKGWPASEIEAYIQSCIAQRDGITVGDVK
jgi:prophage regulatory protein